MDDKPLDPSWWNFAWKNGRLCAFRQNQPDFLKMNTLCTNKVFACNTCFWKQGTVVDVRVVVVLEDVVVMDLVIAAAVVDIDVLVVVMNVVFLVVLFILVNKEVAVVVYMLLSDSEWIC